MKTKKTTERNQEPSTRPTCVAGVVGRVDLPEELACCLKENRLTKLVFQSLDLTGCEERFLQIDCTHCIFLDCRMSTRLREHLNGQNHVFGRLDVPYAVFPANLYNKDVLYDCFDPRKPESYEQTLDRLIFNRFREYGAETNDVEETLARALHDCSMRIAKQELLSGFLEHDVIAIMGGHRLSRDSDAYRQLSRLARRLTEKGKLMVSGGGPGAMEATHLGAWFAGRQADALDRAIDQLSEAPVYSHPLWLSKAFEVLAEYPESTYRSLSIPTWFYGHEPPTPFASDICKLFENSLREEGLLAIAKGGVVYAPGSAGTMQEIFQDLAQNHYESYGYASPMIFFGKSYWTEEIPIYPLLTALQEKGALGKHVCLFISDEIDEIIDYLITFANNRQ